MNTLTATALRTLIERSRAAGIPVPYEAIARSSLMRPESRRTTTPREPMHYAQDCSALPAKQILEARTIYAIGGHYL